MDDKKAITKKQWLFIILTMMMLAGLFLSRVLLSISSVLMLWVFIANEKDHDNLRRIIGGVLLLLLPVIVSGLWSGNKHDWWRAVEVKLPLVIIALGISAATISLRTWRWLTRIFIGFTTVGTFWSLWQYFNNADVILKDYLRAKVLDTPLDNDHIRFSWLVVLCVVLSWYLIKNCKGRLLKTITILNMTWLIFYLHFLSAKTGLLCLYIAAFIFIVHYIFVQRKWLLGVGILIGVIALPVIAYHTLPTFKNRLQYVRYDFNNYSTGNFIPGLSDGARVLSLKAGKDITMQHPLSGVGFGDILPAVDQWHQQHQPNSLIAERFMPLNEWLIYGAGSGILGMLCFTIGLWLLISLIWKRGSITDRVIAIVLLIPLITDDTLESQFGVFIFVFALMWIWLHKKLNQPAVA